jgi:hypothetical protein
MHELQDLLTKFDQIEIIVIKIFGLVGLLLICFLVLWSHIQSINEIRKQSSKVLKIRRRDNSRRKKKWGNE